MARSLSNSHTVLTIDTLRFPLLAYACVFATAALAQAPPNSTPGTATELTSAEFTDANVNFPGSPTFSVNSADNGNCNSGSDGWVFYRFAAAASGPVTVSLDPKPGGIQAILFYASDDADLTQADAQAVTVSPDNDCALRSTATLTASAGVQYYVAAHSQVATTVTFSASGVLPASLSDFGARAGGDGVGRLWWATASETDNAGFAVEHRGPHADAFTEVGYVDGAGTSTGSRDYDYTVRDLAPGTHLFRLRQEDFDGATAYSRVVSLTVGGATDAVSLTVSATPSTSGAAEVALALPSRQPVTVSVHDALGRRVGLLHEGPAEEVLSLALPGNLPSGHYVVRAEGPGVAEAIIVSL